VGRKSGTYGGEKIYIRGIDFLVENPETDSHLEDLEVIKINLTALE